MKGSPSSGIGATLAVLLLAFGAVPATPSPSAATQAGHVPVTTPAPTPRWVGGPMTERVVACDGISSTRRRNACRASLMPASYSMMQMGVPDYGGGPVQKGPKRHLDSFRGPEGVPDQVLTLTAAMGNQPIGRTVERVMTFNGSTPGPTLTLMQGALVEVHLRNANVPRGVTIHWHGVDVPGREDGVAGVTQNAVLPGEEYVYRFVVPDAGT